jgi:NAD(P)-dependent dehydrogenase (short-subunit alcohol dehydrogenase family)
MKKRIVLTGMTSGIGKALVYQLVQDGYEVIGIARNEARLNGVADDLKDAPGIFYPVVADFMSFSAVQEAVNKIYQRFSNGFDVLINNAALVPKPKMVTEDGFEAQYQVNHLMPVYLIESLLPLLKKADGMVITTSSDAHKRAKFDPDDLEGLKKYHSVRSYCRTKLYNVMMTNYYNDKNDAMPFYAVHPGRVKTEIGTKNTSKLYAFLWRLFTRKGFKPEATVPTYMYLIKMRPTPGYYYLEKPLDIKKEAENPQYIQHLMTTTLTQLDAFLT